MPDDWMSGLETAAAPASGDDAAADKNNNNAGKLIVTLSYPHVVPLLKQCKVAATREQVRECRCHCLRRYRTLNGCRVRSLATLCISLTAALASNRTHSVALNHTQVEKAFNSRGCPDNVKLLEQIATLRRWVVLSTVMLHLNVQPMMLVVVRCVLLAIALPNGPTSVSACRRSIIASRPSAPFCLYHHLSDNLH